MAQESTLESYFKLQIEKMGGLCLKFVSPGYSGVPDRIVLFKGHVYFVELKAPNHRLKPRQQFVRDHFKKQNIEVFVIDGMISLAYFLNKVKNDLQPA